MSVGKPEDTEKNKNAGKDEKAVEEPGLYVGAVIAINGKDINLVPSTPINQTDTYGLKLSLDKPVDLGTFGAAMASICNDIGVENPLDEAKINNMDVKILKTAATKLVSANMRIEALKYEQPPKKYDTDPKTQEDAIDPKTKKKILANVQDPTKYVFVASINWKDDVPVDPKVRPDFFKLKGLILGISSGYTAKDGENLEVQAAFQSALQAISPTDSQKLLKGAYQ